MKIVNPKSKLGNHAVARSLPLLLLAFFLFDFAMAAPAAAQESRTLTRYGKVHVTGYTIDMELFPQSHTLKAKAVVRFTPDDDSISTVFELNNNLKPQRIVDSTGKTVNVERFTQEGTLRMTFDHPLLKGKPDSFTIEYDGVLADGNNQPVEGLKLAYVGDPVSYLLYPGRWFPVANYGVERYTAEFNVTVPAAYRVLTPGNSLGAPKTAPGGKLIFSSKFDRASFPGSVAVVREPVVRATSGGAPVDVYFRGAEKPQSEAYGDAAGKMLTYFNTKFGPTLVTNWALVEIDEGSVNSYAAPGIIFLSPIGIGQHVNNRLLSNEVAHQWWRYTVTPASRPDLWIDVGMGAYGELLYTEEAAGKAAAEELGREFSILALSNDSTAITRSQNLEEYSPEYDAVLAKKPAVVINMLRMVVGDQAFFNGLRNVMAKYSGGGVTTDQFRAEFEATSKLNLEGFFIQWFESTGAPEFKSSYTIYRTQKGFKIVGQIRQDLDTFKMPVEIRVETEGNPETQRVDVAGTASDFTIETFGRPKKVVIDPDNRVLKYSANVRLKVAIAKGQQYADAGEYDQAIKEYQKALEQNKNSSLGHFRLAEVFFNQGNFQTAANAFRDALNGDRDPAWTEVWSHISLGKIYDITGQRDRAVNEYRQAQRTRDDTQGAQAEAEQYLKEPYKRERKGQ
jgi:tetratricopeptide (TPR) repeat protein